MTNHLKNIYDELHRIYGDDQCSKKITSRNNSDEISDQSVVNIDSQLVGVDAPNPFGLFVEIHETKGIAGSFSSWFEHWGGVIGAAHSVEAWPGGAEWKPGMERDEWPEWTKKYADDEIIIRPDGLDVALFGCDIPKRAPIQIRVGDRVRLRGYPAGVTKSAHYEIRNGTAYLDRPEEFLNDEAPSWIVRFDDGSVLAVGGMSGGVVTIVQNDNSEIIVATLITQNSRADLDGDGIEEHSSDVTELYDVWKSAQ